MSKLKNLSDLDSLYSMVQENAAKMPAIENGNKQPDILLTDASIYLPTSSKQEALNENAPKVGEGFGKKEEKLAKDTGPEAAEGFKKDEAKEEQEAAKETKQEEGDMEAAEKNEEAPEKEKVEETVDSSSKTPKYNKQTFTMPKSKFQKLYEDAVNGVPFVAQEEEQIAPVEPAADHEEPAMGGPEGDEGEEACCTHEEAIEMVEKLLKFLKKDTAYDKEHGDLGDEDQAFTGGGEEEGAMGEAVEAEDLGHPLEGAKSEELKDGHKIHKVGGSGVTKVKGAASEQGASFKNEPAPKKEKESAHLKDGHKLHTVGNLTPDKGESNAFTK